MPAINPSDLAPVPCARCGVLTRDPFLWPDDPATMLCDACLRQQVYSFVELANTLLANSRVAWMLFLILLAGCTPQYHKSDLQTEQGKVVYTMFIPGVRDVTLRVVPYIDADGDASVKTELVDNSTRDRWLVVVQWKHGKLDYDSTWKSSTAYSLYRNHNAGDDVLIQYREVYKVTAATEQAAEKREFYEYEIVSILKAEE